MYLLRRSRPLDYNSMKAPYKDSETIYNKTYLYFGSIDRFITLDNFVDLLEIEFDDDDQQDDVFIYQPIEARDLFNVGKYEFTLVVVEDETGVNDDEHNEFSKNINYYEYNGILSDDEVSKLMQCRLRVD